MPNRDQALRESRYRAAEARLWASLGAAPVERRFTLPRFGISVRTQETGDGPPVVFIPGAQTAGISWAGTAARMTGFRCILLDRPGTGLSEPLVPAPDARSLPGLADELLVDVLDALELEAADIVATSLGGYVALRTAAAHPERIRRLVEVGWPVGAPSSTLPLPMRLAGLPGVGRVIAAAPATHRSMAWLFRRMGHGRNLESGRITEPELAMYVAVARHSDTIRHELGRASAFVSPLRGLRSLVLPDELLARVRAPTLFLWGDRDGFGGLDVGAWLVERMPDARLVVIPGAGHTPWLDDVDRVAAEAAEFLRA